MTPEKHNCYQCYHFPLSLVQIVSFTYGCVVCKGSKYYWFVKSSLSVLVSVYWTWHRSKQYEEIGVTGWWHRKIQKQNLKRCLDNVYDYETKTLRVGKVVECESPCKHFSFLFKLHCPCKWWFYTQKRKDSRDVFSNG